MRMASRARYRCRIVQKHYGHLFKTHRESAGPSHDESQIRFEYVCQQGVNRNYQASCQKCEIGLENQRWHRPSSLFDLKVMIRSEIVSIVAVLLLASCYTCSPFSLAVSRGRAGSLRAHARMVQSASRWGESNVPRRCDIDRE